MSKKDNYVSEFTNRYGEEWIFEYDYTSKKGTLRGSDVDWQSYYVIDGQAEGLILNKEELTWLRKTWIDAVSN